MAKILNYLVAGTVAIGIIFPASGLTQSNWKFEQSEKTAFGYSRLLISTKYEGKTIYAEMIDVNGDSKMDSLIFKSGKEVKRFTPKNLPAFLTKEKFEKLNDLFNKTQEGFEPLKLEKIAEK